MTRAAFLQFEKNNPKAAALLAFSSTKHLQFCSTKKGEQNLYNTNSKEYYHDQNGALEEAIRHFSPPKTQVLIQYGIGLGYSYLAAKKWLEEDARRFFIVLEDDLAVIDRFLGTQQALDFFKNPQVRFFFLEKGHEDEVFDEILWGTYPEQFAIQNLPLYAEKKKEKAHWIEKELFLSYEEQAAIVYEYYVAGMPFYSNFWRNISFLPQSRNGAKLFKKFSNFPVICVAAGPSLAQDLEYLRQLQDRAIIIAGGSAINILTIQGIQPHFGVTCDPNTTQYSRFRENRAFQMPLFYRCRANFEALTVSSGPKLYLKGSDGFTTPDFFERNLTGKQLAGGRGVSYLNIAIAHALGAKTIILLGYDLSYTNGAKYAPGIEVDAHEHSTENRIMGVDFRHAPIMTEWKWLSEAREISLFKKQHPRCKLYNATAEGIDIENVPRVDLKSFFDEKAFLQCDIDGLIHTELEQIEKIALPLDLCRKKVEMLRKSLQRMVEVSEELVLLASKAQGDFSEDPRYTELMNKLQKEKGYRYFLQLFDKMHTKLDHFRRLFYLHDALSKKENKRRGCDIQLAHYKFLRNVLKANIRLLEVSDVPCKDSSRNNKVMSSCCTNSPSNCRCEAPPFSAPLLHGFIRHYFPSGELASETYYIHGKKEGRALYFTLRGELSAYLNFKNGLRHGEQVYFHDNGVVATWLLYDCGMFVEALEYYPDGELRRFLSDKDEKDLFFLPSGELLPIDLPTE